MQGRLQHTSCLHTITTVYTKCTLNSCDCAEVRVANLQTRIDLHDILLCIV